MRTDRPTLLTVLPALLLALAGLAGCTPDFTLRRIAPAPAQVSAAGGDTRPPGRHESTRAAADAAESLRVLAATDNRDTRPETLEARRIAAGRLLHAYAPAMLRATGRPVPVSLPDGRVLQLRLRRGTGASGLQPEKFVGLEPASDFRVTTTKARIIRTPGVGVPLVATLRPVPPISVPGPAPIYSVAGFTWAVTALPVLDTAPTGDAEAGTLNFDLYNPSPNPRAVYSEISSPPLAADYTTPTAIALAHFTRQDRGIRGFLDGANHDFGSCGIYLYGPPDPDKIPIVLVHGLISDPTTFGLLQNALESDPDIRRRFQFCFFYYPSSLPVPYSAMLLREDLAKFVQKYAPDGTHPAMHRMVLVGHSMGGMLCRLAISDSGDTYYDHLLTRPLDQLTLTPDQRDLMRRAFFYRADPDISVVVFVATPHKGSGLAAGLLGNLGRLIVRLPIAVRGRISAILTNNQKAIVPGGSLKSATSMGSLTPSDPLIAAIQAMPMRAGVGLHSVIGNRGRPGPLIKSSDGIVPYTSSHLPQAQSETIVPRGHTGTLLDPGTSAEISGVLHGWR